MFFGPIIKWAEEILESFEQCAVKSAGTFYQYRHPVITVSVSFI